MRSRAYNLATSGLARTTARRNVYRVPIGSSSSQRVRRAVSRQKAHTGCVRHNTQAANTAGGIERTMPRGRARTACTHSLLRAVDGPPNPGRGDDVADDQHLAARTTTRKIRSAKNFLRDHHEFFVVANITARKFGWTRVFPAAVGPRTQYRPKSLASALPDGATDPIGQQLCLRDFK